MGKQKTARHNIILGQHSCTPILILLASVCFLRSVDLTSVLLP